MSGPKTLILKRYKLCRSNNFMYNSKQCNVIVITNSVGFRLYIDFQNRGRSPRFVGSICQLIPKESIFDYFIAHSIYYKLQISSTNKLWPCFGLSNGARTIPHI